MRKVLVLAVAAAIAVTAAGCGASGKSSSKNATVQREAALYEIDQIEKTWHRAATTHNVDLMMSIWAKDATFNFGGQTYTGRAAIRKVFEGAGPFQPQNNWVSDTPAYKIRTTVNGDVGTIYFQCHYIDRKTRKVVNVVGADQNVKKIGGKWLITSADAATATL